MSNSNINNTPASLQFDLSAQNNFGPITMTDQGSYKLFPEISFAMAWNEAGRAIGRGKAYWLKSKRLNNRRGDGQTHPIVIRNEIWTQQEMDIIDRMQELRSRIEHFCADSRLQPSDVVMPVEVQHAQPDANNLVSFKSTKSRLKHMTVLYLPNPHVVPRDDYIQLVNRRSNISLNVQSHAQRLGPYAVRTNRDVMRRLLNYWNIHHTVKFEEMIEECYDNMNPGPESWRAAELPQLWNRNW